jgi:hypothetical protein
MTSGYDRRTLARMFGPGFVALAVSSALLGLLTSLPIPVGVGLGVIGAVLSSFVRAKASRDLRFLGIVPALLVLGVFVVELPVETITELAAGVSALLLLLWCADDPDAYPGALGRGATSLAVPAAVFGIALTSSLLLPSGLGSLGIAAALLAGSVAAVAVLLGAPRTFDRDASATS